MDIPSMEAALDKVRPALDADGFGLTFGSLDEGGTVEVVLEASEDACGECLVPDEMLIEIVQSAMAGEGVERNVTLTKRGFED